MNRSTATYIIFALVLLTSAISAAEPVAVAVLNFANQAQGPEGSEWNWLEKGLADLVINDLSTQDGLLLVDRDSMQEVLTAEGIPITPDMDLQKLTQVFVQKFKVARVVFGNFIIEDEKVGITASIIDAYSGELIQRLSVEGKADDVLKVQKQLSGKIIAELLNRQDGEKIAAALPVWTESLPASRLLYEAVDKFDHGEFSEAWLYARRAKRLDPKYPDALYWVGRMHYYMLQYPHARRYFEEFVYKHTGHPRIGDAVLEYIDTYERTIEDPVAIMHMYEDLLETVPLNAKMLNVFADDGRVTLLGDWLRYQLANHYIQRTEYARAIKLLLVSYPGPYDNLQATEEEKSFLFLMSYARSCAFDRLGQAIAYHGPWCVKEEFSSVLDTAIGNVPLPVVFWRPGMKVVNVFPIMESWIPNHKNCSGLSFRWKHCNIMFVSPPQYRLNKVKFKAETEVELPKSYAVHIDIRGGADWLSYGQGRNSIIDLMEPWSKVMLIKGDLPHYCCAFTATCYMYKENDEGENMPTGDPSARLSALEASMQIEPVSNSDCGSIWLKNWTGECRQVWLDGSKKRGGEGFFSFVPPGKHEIRVYDYGRTYRTYNVCVTPGEIVEVLHDPGITENDRSCGLTENKVVFSSDSIANGRFSRSSPDRRRPGKAVMARGMYGELVMGWQCDDDLWIAASHDEGESWKTSLLPVPVNSAHVEATPCISQASDGRWVLAFESDRGIPRRTRLYSCWSWDLKRWSNPRVVFDYALCESYPGQTIWRTPFASWPECRAAVFLWNAIDPEGRNYEKYIEYDCRSGMCELREILVPNAPGAKYDAWGTMIDKSGIIHVFGVLYLNRTDPNGTVFHMYGPSVSELKTITMPREKLLDKFPWSFRLFYTAIPMVMLDGKVYVYTDDGDAVSLYEPLEVNGQLDFRRVATIPFMILRIGFRPVQLGRFKYGFANDNNNTVTFQKVNLCR